MVATVATHLPMVATAVARASPHIWRATAMATFHDHLLQHPLTSTACEIIKPVTRHTNTKYKGRRVDALSKSKQLVFLQDHNGYDTLPRTSDLNARQA